MSVKLNTNWLAIIVFSLLAISISAIFRPGAFDFYNYPDASIFVILLGVTIFVGWGPALAAIICWKIFGREKNESSFLGTWPLGAFLIAGTPAAVFGVFGYPNDFGMNSHLAGMIIGLLIFLYALGEEIGWRGFFHDKLSPRPIWLRALIIAPVWWIWHLWFLSDGTDIQSIITGFGIVLVASFFLSWIVSESRSWLSAGGFHCVANIGFMTMIIDLPSKDRLTIAATILGLMIIVHHIWKLRTERMS